ncbi:Fc.00g021310.m01.CDS01 [Cosmosporella sp. VM-42]
MADQRRMSHISDDWEEVDEAASVRSVDSFDGDDLIALSRSVSPVPSPKPADSPLTDSPPIDTSQDKVPVHQQEPFFVPYVPKVTTVGQPPVPESEGPYPIVSNSRETDASPEQEPLPDAYPPAPWWELPKSSPPKSAESTPAVGTYGQTYDQMNLPIRQQTKHVGRQPSWSSFGFSYGAQAGKIDNALKDEPSSPIPIESTKKSPDEELKTPGYNDSLTGDFRYSHDSEEYGGDAVFYHSSLLETRDLADCVAACAKELGANKISTVSMLEVTCCDISGLLYELEPIQAAYASDYTKNGGGIAGRSLPLNPNLIIWMDSVKLDLQDVFNQMERLRPRSDPVDKNAQWPLSAKSIPFRINSYIAERVKGLEQARKTFQEFLPILKADYNEFRTGSMNFPTYQAEDAQKKTRREPPSPAVSRIRRELYNLKDQLQDIILFFTDLVNSIPAQTLDGAPDALRSLVDLVETITTIVTNHGSEWIDFDLASPPKRIISFPDFLNLNPDILRDITMHLQEFHRQLDLSDEPVFRKYSREMIRNHQITSLTEGGQLYNLISTIELVESMLMANR